MIKWMKGNQITVINAATTVILIAIVITFLLTRAASLQRQTTEESLNNLGGQIASEVQSFYFTYYDICRILYGSLQSVESIAVERRRDFVNDTMKGIISSTRTLLSIYTIIRPNELDVLDSFYANTEGTDETGQFISGFSREKGWLEYRAFPEHKSLLDIEESSLSSYFNVSGVAISEPVIIPVLGFCVIQIQMPLIINDKWIGIIGIAVNLDRFQYLIGSIIPFKTGRVMLCNTNGTIIAHSNYTLRGFKILDADFMDSQFLSVDYSQIYETMIYLSSLRKSPYFKLSCMVVDCSRERCKFLAC
jgi:methyl-accepting chemotaxis protein